MSLEALIFPISHLLKDLSHSALWQCLALDGVDALTQDGRHISKKLKNPQKSAETDAKILMTKLCDKSG